jgi:hypothetical protein
MNKVINKTIKWLIILLVIVGLAYGAYLLYSYVIEDVTRKIKQGISQGVSKGIGDTINPLKWFKKVF